MHLHQNETLNNMSPHVGPGLGPEPDWEEPSTEVQDLIDRMNAVADRMCSPYSPVEFDEYHAEAFKHEFYYSRPEADRRRGPPRADLTEWVLAKLADSCAARGAMDRRLGKIIEKRYASPFTPRHPGCKPGEVFVATMRQAQYDAIPFESKRSSRRHITKFGGPHILQGDMYAVFVSREHAAVWKNLRSHCTNCEREKYAGPCFMCGAGEWEDLR